MEQSYQSPGTHPIQFIPFNLHIQGSNSEQKAARVLISIPNFSQQQQKNQKYGDEFSSTLPVRKRDKTNLHPSVSETLQLNFQPIKLQVTGVLGLSGLTPSHG